MNRADQKAWGDFWQARNGRKGCLPEGLKEIDAVQKQCWAEFAGMQPMRGRLLDLATGNGAVLAKIRRVRPDLKLIGVDSSPVLPSSPKGMKLISGVPMEKLPFGDSSFAAVTSQFGIEYGNIAAAAGEVGRVLRAGARLRFIVHHSESPVLAHNRSRREGLTWALQTSGYFERAKGLARARLLSPIPTPPAFRRAIDEARARYSKPSVGEEFLTAVLQTLELGRSGAPQEMLDTLADLEGEALNEIARIDSLERAVCDGRRIEEIRGALRAAGIETVAPELLKERSHSRPFAWLLDGVSRQRP